MEKSSLLWGKAPHQLVIQYHWSALKTYIQVSSDSIQQQVVFAYLGTQTLWAGRTWVMGNQSHKIWAHCLLSPKDSEMLGHDKTEHVLCTVSNYSTYISCWLFFSTSLGKQAPWFLLSISIKREVTHEHSNLAKSRKGKAARWLARSWSAGETFCELIWFWFSSGSWFKLILFSVITGPGSPF